MKDIFFYYRKKTSDNRILIEQISQKYPHIKFKFMSGSIFSFINKTVKESTTDFCWIFELGTTGWEEILSYEVKEWDREYLHIFESKSARAYLVPKISKFENDNFINKKVFDNNAIKSPPYDVFFICYDENNAEKNLRYVREKRPDVKIVQGVKGIFNAHLEAAQQSNTEFFWVVDADATVIDAFDFEYNVSEWDFDVVHIWKSYNPINRLEYGHGGVKLIPRHLILMADEDTAVDITTSIGAKIKVLDEISNINNFATNPFNTWRAAFRECAKLSSKIIANQVNDESDQRLFDWLTIGGDRPFGEYSLSGASAGEWYGKTHKDNKNLLAMINNYEWLEEQFQVHTTDYPPEQFIQIAELLLNPPPPPPTSLIPAGPYQDLDWESPAELWKDAFIMSAKSASQDEDVTEKYVTGNQHPNRKFLNAGVSAGIWYGTAHKNDPEMLSNIDNINWVYEQFVYHQELNDYEQFNL
jgi:hypothetical protein